MTETQVPTLNELRQRFNRWSRHEGAYNWVNPSEKQAQFLFHLRDDAPKELQRSYLVKLEHEARYLNIDPSDSALDVARALRQMIDENFLFHGDERAIKALVQYLESVSDQDYLDGLRYRIAYAKAEAEKWTKKAAELEAELACAEAEAVEDAAQAQAQ